MLEKSKELTFRETKEMMSSQTKLSVDTAKEVQADATLKTKVWLFRMIDGLHSSSWRTFLES